ncbi:unnamed protein product [Strongylus vulgaris]|uniref:Uncharacterized protein n=1 Tax=Strongylus vulgaris TaxID=40348 RepID=A0A3P7KLX1_STRVU|nr:unnamed protein product [Strongylus vulgaris]
MRSTFGLNLFVNGLTKWNMAAFFIVYLFGEVRGQLPVHYGEAAGQACVFNNYIINSTTISQFPTGDDYCFKVEGSIRIDETTDVLHEELFGALGRIETMSGTVEIMNTAFTNISFFVSLFGLFYTHEDRFGRFFLC